MNEIQFKVPISAGEDIVRKLKQYGYDVGTDAYYADPQNYYTLIVRVTDPFGLAKEIARSCGIKTIIH